MKGTRFERMCLERLALFWNIDSIQENTLFCLADPITIGGFIIEEVTEFTYLGTKLTNDGNSESEVKATTSKARGAFVALNNIWKNNKITNRTNIRLFKSNVLSVLIYAAESWKDTKVRC